MIGLRSRHSRPLLFTDWLYVSPGAHAPSRKGGRAELRRLPPRAADTAGSRREWGGAGTVALSRSPPRGASRLPALIFLPLKISYRWTLPETGEERMSRGTSSTENGQGGGGSRREIRKGASRRRGRARDKCGFKDTKINNVSVNCCQEAGEMRTENCFWRLWQERCQWEEGDMVVDCLFSKFALKRGKRVTARVRRWETPPQTNWKTFYLFLCHF